MQLKLSPVPQPTPSPSRLTDLDPQVGSQLPSPVPVLVQCILLHLLTTISCQINPKYQTTQAVSRAAITLTQVPHPMSGADQLPDCDGPLTWRLRIGGMV